VAQASREHRVGDIVGIDTMANLRASAVKIDERCNHPARSRSASDRRRRGHAGTGQIDNRFGIGQQTAARDPDECLCINNRRSAVYLLGAGGTPRRDRCGPAAIMQQRDKVQVDETFPPVNSILHRCLTPIVDCHSRKGQVQEFVSELALPLWS
jgi:hypothetical protein